jgi:hypothetical protein
MNQAMREISIMNGLNISYFDYGLIKQGRKKLFNYYKTDKISAEQKHALEKAGCTIKGAFCEYAPEIRSVLICFPKGF